MHGSSSWLILEAEGAGHARRTATSFTGDSSENGSSASIRLATERDAEQVAAIYAPDVTDTIISFELEPPSADEMR